MAGSWLLSLFVLYGGLLGGGNELLDYLPTDAYWRAKGVPVSPEVMAEQLRQPPAEELAQLARSLAGGPEPDARRLAARKLEAAGAPALPVLRESAKGDDPDAAALARSVIARIEAAPRAAHVRRLMAVRTLGELRAKSALPALRPLAQSAEPFVAQYAVTAVAQTEGKPLPVRQRAAGVERDVWLLPAGVRAVAQYAPKPDAPVTVNDALARAELPDGMSREAAGDSLAAALVGVAEQVGNVRFDAAVVGASGDLGERSGFVVAVARGWYDRDAVAALLAAQKVPSRTVDGVRVFQPDQENAFFLPSNDRLVFVAAPRGQGPPLREMVAAVRGGAGGLKGDAEIVRLVGTLDTTQPLWGAAKMTAAYRQVPFLGAFDVLTLVGRRDAPDTVSLTLTAFGSNPPQVKGTADQAAAALDEMRRAARARPADPEEDTPAPVKQSTAALLDALRVRADGNRATASAALKASRADVFARFVASAAPGLPRPRGEAERQR